MGQRFDSLDALAKAAAIARELKLPRERLDALRDEAIACLALPDLKPTGRVIPLPQGVVMSAFDSTMTRYALRFRDGTISVRRVADDQEIARFQARGDREIHVFGFSPDGRYLATTQSSRRALTVWDIERRAVALNVPGRLGAARFSPDSQRIAVQHEDGELLVYDLATGQVIRRWREPRRGSPGFPSGRRPDRGLRTTTRKTTAAGFLTRRRAGSSGRSRCRLAEAAVAWSPDGTTLATPCDDSKIYLWDAATGMRKATLEGSTNIGITAAFHPAGTLLASNGWESQAAALGPGPGPALAELDRRIRFARVQPGRTNRSSRMRTN